MRCRLSRIVFPERVCLGRYVSEAFKCKFQRDGRREVSSRGKRPLCSRTDGKECRLVAAAFESGSVPLARGKNRRASLSVVEKAGTNAATDAPVSPVQRRGDVDYSRSVLLQIISANNIVPRDTTDNVLYLKRGLYDWTFNTARLYEAVWLSSAIPPRVQLQTRSLLPSPRNRA